MATKTTIICIKALMASGKAKEAVKVALVACIENCNLVYLNNAYNLVKEYITPAQFSGYLAALTKSGDYMATDDRAFGEVILKEVK